MQLLDLTLPSLPANLALDEALLLQAEAGDGPEVLRFWEWPRPVVVLGSGCRLKEDVELDACQQADVPIARRSSGGGTVLLGKGCLCFSLVLAYRRAPALREIRPSYQHILETIRLVLAALFPQVRLAGTSDLALGRNKFSGNAQQRKRHYLLHHGTILYDFDLGCVGRYLRLPIRQPDYRQSRSHEAFLVNLPCTASELKKRLQDAWQVETNLPAWPEEMVRQLTEEKYSRPEWVHRR
jgi:lipoate-protein ligase A